MTEMNFDAMGRFIYGAVRYGGDTTDIANWIADDLGLAHPAPGDDDALRELYQAFFAKYSDGDVLRDNWERFMTVLKNRPPKA